MNERSTEVLNNYASRVFNDGAMRRYLPGDTYKQLKKIIDQGRPLPDFLGGSKSQKAPRRKGKYSR